MVGERMVGDNGRREDGRMVGDNGRGKQMSSTN